jgi:amino acid adenylation domain-containing protein
VSTTIPLGETTSDSIGTRYWEYPTTIDQEQRLLFREVQQERSAPFVPQRLAIGFRIRGEVKSDVLQAALDGLVRRHSALRVQFSSDASISPDEWREKARRYLRMGVADGGLFHQMAIEPRPVTLRVIDFPGGEPLEEVLQSVVDEELQRPNPSLEPPHVQAVVATSRPEDSILILFVDHLVSDGVSLEILRRDFRQMLRIAADGQASGSGAPDDSFLAYAAEQKERMAGDGCLDSLEFWRTQWAHYGSKRIAPGHFPFLLSSPGQTQRSFASPMAVLEASAQRVKDFVKRCRVTQHTLFLAAFGLLLRNVTGKSEVAVWTHFSNRTKAAYLNSVGWFAQTHLVGFGVSGEITVREWLSAVHRSVLNCSKHQALPLSHLWTHLGCYPRFPDARVLLDFIPYAPQREETIGELILEDVLLPDSAAARLASFGVYVKDRGDTISISIRYLDGLYAAPAVEQFLNRLLALVERLVDGAERSVADFVTASAPSENAGHASETMSEFIFDARRSDFPGVAALARERSMPLATARPPSQEAGEKRLVPVNIPALWPGSWTESSRPCRVIALFGVLLYRYGAQQHLRFEIIAGYDGRGSIELNFASDPSVSALIAQLESSSESRWKSVRHIQCFVPEDLNRFLVSARQEENRSNTLALDCEDDDGKQEMAFAYRGGSHDGEAVLRIATHFERLLNAALQNPDCPVSQLQMSNAKDLGEFLASHGNTTAGFERVTIPDAFEEQARRTANAPALYCNGQVLTYRELHARATQIAGSLQSHSVGPETLVGVYLDDPISVAVAYFGIVMAGGVLVALDPEWPKERLEQVVRDAAPQFILTSTERAPEMPGEFQSLIQEELERPAPGKTFKKVALTPDHAAYVVFTSGSTGTPKGVVGLHRTITAAAKLSHALRADEVFALSASLAFGAGVIGLFFPLLQGAAVLLVSRALAKDLRALVCAWEAAKVTRIVMVPPQLRQLSALGPEATDRLKSVTTVALAGAALPGEMLPAIYELFPQAMVINAYTCLEIGTMATRWETVPGNRIRRPTVGKALPNIRIYILGPGGKVLPQGMPGEIYVGSADLCRGYLNRPELTRERFLPNPFDDPEAPRVYRTGDLGRLLPNGELEYLGRADNQVKIRGNRIELEEIDFALEKHTEVHQAAVIAVPNDGEPRLVAFVSSKPGRSVSAGSLREHLGRCLPSYMIPSLFVAMDKLPMTGNGKIDRQRLPKVSTNRPELDTPYAPPASEIERAVAEIWEAHLKIAGIGIDDPFLEIGGDSLAAVIIAARIQEHFGCEVPMASLFEFPTIRSLSGELQRSVRHAAQTNTSNRSSATA